MKEFLLIFRNEGAAQSAAAQAPDNEKNWMDWIGGVAAQGKYLGGARLVPREGKTLRANNVVTDGPYAEVKEILFGTMTVKVDTLEEALKIAAGCPVIKAGGSVEVRELISRM